MFKQMRFRTNRPRHIQLGDIKDSRVIYFLLGAGFAAFFMSMFFHKGSDWAWWDGFWQNFSTEVFGALMTFILIETIVRARRQKEDDERAREVYKNQLLREVRSRGNDTAVSAVDALREEGWLTDGTLKEHFMSGADLQGAFMSGANLMGAILEEANLQEARLFGANLMGAHLSEINLVGAYVTGANLMGVDISMANLERVHLGAANLKGANLKTTNLIWADLEDAKFDEQTTLPDGTKWSRAVDMKKFTDPDHPEFWQSPFWSKDE